MASEGQQFLGHWKASEAAMMLVSALAEGSEHMAIEITKSGRFSPLCCCLRTLATESLQIISKRHMGLPISD